jgi:predicted Fe-Mo cluster-binding NifX family protein
MEKFKMKIAVITEDGKTISQHFGRAPYYLVATIEDGKIINHEMRDKLGHAQFQAEGHDQHEDANGRHGFGPVAEDHHNRMAQAITDCEVLLCRGMGMGAYESLKTLNIRPLVTDIADIDEAILAYVNGQIVDHVEKLH